MAKKKMDALTLGSGYINYGNVSGVRVMKKVVTMEVLGAGLWQREREWQCPWRQGQK